MGRPLRMYEPNVVYEITTRTIQGRYLLRPSPDVTEVMAGVIGRAQTLYQAVSLYAGHGLSNHTSILLSASDPPQIPAFMGYINGNLSHEIGRLHNWPGKMWERRAKPLAVVDDRALIDRFKYVLAQGCKEGLVESPTDWPGFTCVHALLGERPLMGTWFDRDTEREHRRRGDPRGPYNFATSYEVKFAKLPCWAHLNDADYAARVRELVDEITAETRDKYPRESNPVIGRKAVMAKDPHYRPDSVAKSPAPLCHASTPAKRREYKERFRAYVNSFRCAADKLKQGITDVVFPLFAFAPRFPMSLPP